MKLGCTATMSKQMFSRSSGWENCRYDQNKARQSRSNVKVMLIVFLIGRVSFIMSLFHVVRHKRLQAFEGRSAKEEAWGVDKQHLDAAPWQCTCSCVTPYPSIFDDYCPPAAVLSRFGLFGLFLVPEAKKFSLKGRRFQTVEEIEENSIRDLRSIPQNTFQDVFQNWKNVGRGV